MPHRVFVAFAGGGAKGLVHVGALKALTARKVKIPGFAGTSAGAIVAALAASGYTADELVNPNTGVSLIAELERIDPKFHSATAIFGSGGWTRIDFLRQAFEDLTLDRACAGLGVWIGLGVAFALQAPLGVGGFAMAFAWLFGSLAVVIVGMVWGLVGLATLRDFRQALDTLLRNKVFGPGATRSVRFEDFGPGTKRPTLKIVAANISNRKMRLFSPELSPKIAVADAVAASACLPLIFAPWRIEDAWYVDGGLVSNLPAWPFDEERELDANAITIAFDIESQVVLKPLKWWTWPPSAIETALSGAGQLNTRAMRNIELINLKTDLDLLAFDMRPQDVAHNVNIAHAAARYAIKKRVYLIPKIYQDACKTTHALVISAIGASPHDLLDSPQQRIRVAIAVPDPDFHHSLRLKYTFNFSKTDRDAGIVLPIEGSVVGAAWKAGTPWLERAPFPRKFALPGYTSIALRDLIWPNLAWTLCIPIYGKDKARPAFVVTIDGSSALRTGSTTTAFMSRLSTSVEDFFNSVMLKLESLET